MKRFFIILLALVAIIPYANCGTEMADVFDRDISSLNGKWRIIIDPYDVGYFDYRHQPYDEATNPTGGFFLDKLAKDRTELIEYNFDTSATLTVPGDWNTQEKELFYYEGSVWYRRKFDIKNSEAGDRLFIYFGAANYETDVYFNGHKLGKHIGGFTPFAYEITELAHRTNNSLVVRVNNGRQVNGVPTVNTDWWNYGGLTRDVLLVETPPTFIANYCVRLKPGSTNIIEANVLLDGARKSQKVKISLPKLGLFADAITDTNGYACFEFPSMRTFLCGHQSIRY